MLTRLLLPPITSRLCSAVHQLQRISPPLVAVQRAVQRNVLEAELVHDGRRRPRGHVGRVGFGVACHDALRAAAQCARASWRRVQLADTRLGLLKHPPPIEVRAGRHATAGTSQASERSDTRSAMSRCAPSYTGSRVPISGGVLLATTPSARSPRASPSTARKRRVPMRGCTQLRGWCGTRGGGPRSGSRNQPSAACTTGRANVERIESPRQAPRGTGDAGTAALAAR
jgi:hypothetical protein